MKTESDRSSHVSERRQSMVETNTVAPIKRWAHKVTVNLRLKHFSIGLASDALLLLIDLIADRQ